MAGHSKWANIRHRKAAQDAKRGKIFTKLIREIVVAAKTGGASPEDNPRLRAAIDKALSANMKKDTIDNAIARGVGAGDDSAMDEVTYEGYATGGVAILIEAMTDNRNRTVAEIRHALSKRGGNLGTDGSVAYLFSRQGQINFASDVNEEQLIELALEAGANDIINNDDHSIDVMTDWEDFLSVKDALLTGGLVPEQAEVTMVPSTTVELDKSAAEKLIALIDELEELDDTQNVYTNAQISEQVLQEMALLNE